MDRATSEKQTTNYDMAKSHVNDKDRLNSRMDKIALDIITEVMIYGIDNIMEAYIIHGHVHDNTERRQNRSN